MQDGPNGYVGQAALGVPSLDGWPDRGFSYLAPHYLRINDVSGSLLGGLTPTASGGVVIPDVTLWNGKACADSEGAGYSTMAASLPHPPGARSGGGMHEHLGGIVAGAAAPSVSLSGASAAPWRMFSASGGADSADASSFSPSLLLSPPAQRHPPQLQQLSAAPRLSAAAAAAGTPPGSGESGCATAFSDGTVQYPELSLTRNTSASPINSPLPAVPRPSGAVPAAFGPFTLHDPCSPPLPRQLMMPAAGQCSPTESSTPAAAVAAGVMAASASGPCSGVAERAPGMAVRPRAEPQCDPGSGGAAREAAAVASCDGEHRLSCGGGGDGGCQFEAEEGMKQEAGQGTTPGSVQLPPPVRVTVGVNAFRQQHLQHLHQLQQQSQQPQGPGAKKRGREAVTTNGGGFPCPPLQQEPEEGSQDNSQMKRGSGGGGGISGMDDKPPVYGMFYPDRYMAGVDCIRVDEAFVSRSRFEKLGGSLMAKWYRSIRVVETCEPLGTWLERHGLPVFTGKARQRRPRMPPGATTGSAAAANGRGIAAQASASRPSDGGGSHSHRMVNPCGGGGSGLKGAVLGSGGAGRKDGAKAAAAAAAAKAAGAAAATAAAAACYGGTGSETDAAAAGDGGGGMWSLAEPAAAAVASTATAASPGGGGGEGRAAVADVADTVQRAQGACPVGPERESAVGLGLGELMGKSNPAADSAAAWPCGSEAPATDPGPAQEQRSGQPYDNSRYDNNMFVHNPKHDNIRYNYSHNANSVPKCQIYNNNCGGSSSIAASSAEMWGSSAVGSAMGDAGVSGPVLPPPPVPGPAGAPTAAASPSQAAPAAAAPETAAAAAPAAAKIIGSADGSLGGVSNDGGMGAASGGGARGDLLASAPARESSCLALKTLRNGVVRPGVYLLGHRGELREPPGQRHQQHQAQQLPSPEKQRLQPSLSQTRQQHLSPCGAQHQQLEGQQQHQHHAYQHQQHQRLGKLQQKQSRSLQQKQLASFAVGGGGARAATDGGAPLFAPRDEAPASLPPSATMMATALHPDGSPSPDVLSRYPTSRGGAGWGGEGLPPALSDFPAAGAGAAPNAATAAQVPSSATAAVVSHPRFASDGRAFEAAAGRYLPGAARPPPAEAVAPGGGCDSAGGAAADVGGRCSDGGAAVALGTFPMPASSCRPPDAPVLEATPTTAASRWPSGGGGGSYAPAAATPSAAAGLMPYPSYNYNCDGGNAAETLEWEADVWLPTAASAAAPSQQQLQQQQYPPVQPPVQPHRGSEAAAAVFRPQPFWEQQQAAGKQLPQQRPPLGLQAQEAMPAGHQQQPAASLLHTSSSSSMLDAYAVLPPPPPQYPESVPAAPLSVDDGVAGGGQSAGSTAPSEPPPPPAVAAAAAPPGTAALPPGPQSSGGSTTAAAAAGAADQLPPHTPPKSAPQCPPASRRWPPFGGSHYWPYHPYHCHVRGGAGFTVRHPVGPHYSPSAAAAAAAAATGNPGSMRSPYYRHPYTAPREMPLGGAMLPVVSPPPSGYCYGHPYHRRVPAAAAAAPPAFYRRRYALSGPGAVEMPHGAYGMRYDPTVMYDPYMSARAAAEQLEAPPREAGGAAPAPYAATAAAVMARGEFWEGHVVPPAMVGSTPTASSAIGAGPATPAPVAGNAFAATMRGGTAGGAAATGATAAGEPYPPYPPAWAAPQPPPGFSSFRPLPGSSGQPPSQFAGLEYGASTTFNWEDAAAAADGADSALDWNAALMMGKSPPARGQGPAAAAAAGASPGPLAALNQDINLGSASAAGAAPAVALGAEFAASAAGPASPFGAAATAGTCGGGGGVLGGGGGDGDLEMDSMWASFQRWSALEDGVRAAQQYQHQQ